MRALLLSHTYADPASRGKLRALVAQGCTVSVAVPERWTDAGGQRTFVSPYASEGGVRIAPIRVRGADGPVRSARWSRDQLRRLLTDFRPEIVQVEEEPGSRVADLVTRLAEGLGVPAVAFTGDPFPDDVSFWAERRRRATLARSRGIVAAHRLSAAHAGRMRPGLPVEVIPQVAVALPSAPTHSAEPTLRVGFVGRLVPEKGLDALFRACVKLQGAWTLTVVGSGPALEPLEALAERLGIGSRVTWLGGLSRADLSSLWPTLGCLVAPSRTAVRWIETYPVACLEAMAHGVPVVASDSGALPEFVGGAGLVVPEDDVGALCGALLRLCRSTGERESIGTAGRRRVVEEFSEDALARKTLAFWRRLLARP